MLKVISIATIGIAVWAVAGPANAIDNKYQVTDAEREACTVDAVRFCSDAAGDEDMLLVCMKANRSKLDAGCRSVFDAGIRRRGLQ